MASGIDMPHPWLIAEDCHVDAAVIMKAFLGAGMQSGDYILYEDTHPLHIGDWRYWRESDGMFDLGLYKAAFTKPYEARPEKLAEEKLEKVEKTMGDLGNLFLVDTGIQDMFGMVRGWGCGWGTGFVGRRRGGEGGRVAGERQYHGSPMGE